MRTHFPTRVWEVTTIEEFPDGSEKAYYSSRQATPADAKRRRELCTHLFKGMTTMDINNSVGTVTVSPMKETAAQRIERKFNDMSKEEKRSLIAELSK